jgi:mono/diheme cytochrome c family protein
MANRAAKWLIIANLTIGANAVVWAQDTELGISAYRLACAVCHGIDGKGKGPLSEQLKVAPTDLTVLAKKNNGVFPVSTIYEVIDGRKVIAAHGNREMPIWGAYNRMFLYPTDKLLDSSYDVEVLERTRILTVIDYLNRIQEK